MSQMVVHFLMLAVELLQVETLLPFVQRFIPNVLDALSEQILLIFWHYLP